MDFIGTVSVVLHRTLIAFSLALCGTPASGATTQPNILLLVAEDLSPRIGAFGDAIAMTPNIDQLAEQGVRFTRVFTTAGVCAPSRAALMTGQYQQSFGAQHMRASTGPLGPYLAQPDPRVRAFPELLRANGYYTFTDRKLDYQFSGIYAGSGPFSLWDKEGAGDYAWRERRQNQPFFGLINFMETHESGVMRASGPAHSRAHAATQQARTKAGLVAPKVTSPNVVTLPPYLPDLLAVRTDIARHYDNIHAMDKRVGRILAALSADGLADNTIVIWTTDHGDGLPRAKRELFDSGIHVPLVMYIPSAVEERLKLLPGQVNTSNANLVSFVDLAPTLLAMAQINAPDYLHGQSFLSSKRQYIFAARDRIDEVNDRQRAVRDERYKYIRSWHPDVPGGHPLAYRDNLDMVRAWRSAWQAQTLDATRRRWFEPTGEEQLYDTQVDPHELNNLVSSPNHQSVLRRLRNRLDQFLTQYPDTSDQSETELRQRFLAPHSDEIPHTPPPKITITDGKLHLTSKIGASIGFRYIGGPWQLYTQPIQTGTIEAKAVRYGWYESEKSVYTTP